MLQRHVEILHDAVVLRDGIEQVPGDLVGVGIEKAQPGESVYLRETIEQRGESVFQAEVLAVAGGVLTDQRDLAYSAGDKLLRLGDHRLEAARTELATQVRDHAEGAGMIAALGNFEIRRCLAGREQTRGRLVVEIRRERGSGAIPCVARKAARLLA